jgi:hypothetical protein
MKVSHVFQLIIMLCLLLLPPGLVAAMPPGDLYSIDCDQGTVTLGDTKDAVLTKCGEPVQIQEGGESWVYDFGPLKGIVHLKFTDERLERIEVRNPVK